MTTGVEQLASVTQQALVNGANAALVLKADGEPEIAQFSDVTLNRDGSFTLTDLPRGRRGTDMFTCGRAWRVPAVAGPFQSARPRASIGQMATSSSPRTQW